MGKVSLKKITRKVITTLALASLPLMATSKAAVSEEQSEAPGNLTEVITKGKFNAVIKTLYYERMFDGNTPDWSTLAIGGNLNYETAPLYGFSAGIGVKTSQGDYSGNDDEVYRDMLAVGDTLFDAESYTALDEYFLRYANWDTQITLGAHSLSTPWLNAHDIRMTPKKYRGVSIINSSIENVKIHGYYLADWLNWTEESYESISSAITGNDYNDEGALVAGAVWQSPQKMHLQAWNYYYNEVLNSFYVSGDYSHTFGNDYTLSGDLRFLSQQDVGDALAGDIDTYTAGGFLSFGAYGAALTLYYGTNGNDDLIAPFGHSKIISQQVLELTRADEDAYGVKLAYSFDQVGLNGLSAYIFYAEFSTPDTGANASPDASEVDFDLQYKLTGWFENCSIRLRHAIIDQDEDITGGKDWTDTRVYLVYKY
jgi:hypothetical protein